MESFAAVSEAHDGESGSGVIVASEPRVALCLSGFPFRKGNLTAGCFYLWWSTAWSILMERQRPVTSGNRWRGACVFGGNSLWVGSAGHRNTRLPVPACVPGRKPALRQLIGPSSTARRLNCQPQPACEVMHEEVVVSHRSGPLDSPAFGLSPAWGDPLC